MDVAGLEPSVFCLQSSGVLSNNPLLSIGFQRFQQFGESAYRSKLTPIRSFDHESAASILRFVEAQLRNSGSPLAPVYVWVDPFFEAALPQFQCCRCKWFALATLDMVQPPFCLFAECDTLGLLHYFIEVLPGVRATLRDDFTGAAFSFRFGQMPRAGDRAYLSSHMPSRFLPCHIHPPTNDPPFTACFDMAVLTSSAGHALSSPLHRCRGNDINIACRELQRTCL
jgi:hypothetical protein